MLALPSDIQLLILDNIRLPSHLKALCLVSKACCDLATPCLYRKIKLNMYDKNLMKRFDKSMEAGARVHLESTRNLTFTDSDPIDDPMEIQSRPVPSPYDPYNFPEKGRAMVPLLLEQFPANCLHSFRWLSSNPLDEQTLESLCQNHRNSLKHIHFTTQDPRAVKNLDQVKTIDTWCHERHPRDKNRTAFKAFFTQLSSYNHLERLFLGIEDWRNHNEWLAAWLLSQVAPSDRLGSLRELSLQSIYLDIALYRGLFSIIDFAQLTHLTLWNCHSALDFCSELVQANDVYRLEHFALELMASPNHSSGNSLELLLNKCTKLSSLCLDWKPLGGWLPEEFIQSLDKIGKSLKLLSLQSWSSTDDDTMLPHHFRRICDACPNLEQLGYSISDEYFVNQYRMGYYDNLEPITKLAKLRTLHLRQTFLEPLPENNEVSVHKIPNRQRRFAESFFKHLEERSACRNLEAIIIGFERQFETDDGIQYRDSYSPAHCYRRGNMINQYGRVQEEPRLISLFEFRATSEHTEILDWCSEFTDPAYWMWRVPGRFHDD